MITHVSFALLLLFCAEPVLATDNYSYKADEYATISGGRSPDGRWSIAAHGEGEGGYGKFDFYLMREPAHKEPRRLHTGGSLDTAPLSLIAVWAPGSKHVALLHRIDRHVLDVELFAVTDRKARAVKVPLLLDVVGKHLLKKGTHYELFSRLYRVTWQKADRFVLQEADALDAHEPVFGAGLEPYVTVDRSGSERTFTYFSAQATCEICPKGELRIFDVKALPQSSWSEPIRYSPHLMFDTDRGLHSTETTLSSLDAQKDSK